MNIPKQIIVKSENGNLVFDLSETARKRFQSFIESKVRYKNSPEDIAEKASEELKKRCEDFGLQLLALAEVFAFAIPTDCKKEQARAEDFHSILSCALKNLIEVGKLAEALENAEGYIEQHD